MSGLSPWRSPFIHPEVQEAKITEAKINEARENYRPAAARASLLYFILNDLNKINPIYQFSLKVSHPGHEAGVLSWQQGAPGQGAHEMAGARGWCCGSGSLRPTLPPRPKSESARVLEFTMAIPQAFNVVFEKAIQKTAPADEVKQRVINLTDEITYSVYMYTARGLFERDKLIFLAQVTFQVPKLQPVHSHWRPPRLQTCRTSKQVW